MEVLAFLAIWLLINAAIVLWRLAVADRRDRERMRRRLDEYAASPRETGAR